MVTSLLHDFSVLALIKDLYRVQPQVTFYFLIEIEIAYKKVLSHSIPSRMEWNKIMHYKLKTPLLTNQEHRDKELVVK
jgi:hypothetical protein